MGRYEAGETLASIARTYDCSPPAISYIVSRSRARQPGGEAEATPPNVEPQLVKAQNGEADTGSVAEPAAVPAPPEVVPPAAAEARQAPAPPSERHGDERPPAINGTSLRPPPARPQAGPQPGPQPSAPLSGEQRRTLHLSLGGSGSNGHGPSGEAPARDLVRPAATAAAEAEPSSVPPQRPAQHQPQYGSQHGNGHRDQPRYGFPAAPERSYGDMSARGDAEAARRKDGGSFIDQELRTRVDGDIAAFLAAFDAALAGDTQESRSALREATDRLLRAGARTRIELERLEARVPLTPRDTGRGAEPAWRQR